MTRAVASTLLCSTLAAGVLTACGSSDAVSVEGGTLHVRLDEYRVRPVHVTMAPGRLRLIATNTGRLPHHLAIITDEGRPRRVVADVPTTRRGETAAITVPFLVPGRYRLVCRLANHRSLGGYGHLVVR
jgi:hypothetical protein